MTRGIARTSEWRNGPPGALAVGGAPCSGCHTTIERSEAYECLTAYWHAGSRDGVSFFYFHPSCAEAFRERERA